MPRQATLNFSSQSIKQQPERNADKAVSRDSAIASVEAVAPLSSQDSEQPHCTPFTMDSSYDIPDSTDWINTPLSSFEPLEAALRCQVCKEFYDTPMITVCSHTFCSLCIRRCITTDGKCPTCKKDNQADKLMPNWVVGEIVERFVKARPVALELARKKNEVKEESGKRNKRKLDDTDLEDEVSVRQTRSRNTRSRTRAAGRLQSDPIEVMDSEEDGDEYVPDGMVKCPVCQKSMKEEQVFLHLDTCTGQTSHGRSTRSRTNNSFPPQRAAQQAPSPTPTRLPQMNYTLIRDNALRTKLQQLGIPTWGSKTILQKRHTEWLNLWNANVDSSHPKSKNQLLKELDTWERTQGGGVATSKSKVMEKDFDGHRWIEDNKYHFSDLVANARMKRETPKERDEAQKVENGETRDAENPDIEDQSMEIYERSSHPEPTPEQSSEPQPPADHIPHPYENNSTALAIIRDKVSHATQDNEAAVLPMRLDAPAKPADDIPNPFTSPSKKMPMFRVSEDPVVDVEQSTKV